MVDTDTLLARVSLPEIVASYTPLVRRGQEYAGKCCFHDDKTPSLTVYKKDDKWLFHCFGCGESGDAIDFIRTADGTDFKTAAEKLGATDVWKGRISSPARPVMPERVTTVAPADAGVPNFEFRTLGSPVAKWEYRSSDGGLYGWILRYEVGGKKEIRCMSWGARGTEPPAWGIGAWSKPRPLMHLDELGRRPDDPVVIVEGEKACAAASEILPDYVATTWAGGAQAWKFANWEPLRNRRILLWPDNDEAGRAAMAAVGHLLSDPKGLACR